MAAPDPDDIYRPIQEENEEERSKEIKRLIPKLRALKSHFTAAYNVLTNLITATRGEDNSSFDRSSGTMSALDRARVIACRYGSTTDFSQVHRSYHEIS